MLIKFLDCSPSRSGGFTGKVGGTLENVHNHYLFNSYQILILILHTDKMIDLVSFFRLFRFVVNQKFYPTCKVYDDSFPSLSRKFFCMWDPVCVFIQVMPWYKSYLFDPFGLRFRCVITLIWHYIRLRPNASPVPYSIWTCSSFHGPVHNGCFTRVKDL